LKKDGFLANSDIIKIKGKEDTWTCIFFDEQNKECSIYNDRPVECRALKCWDTGELEKMYAGHRLTREDLVSKVEGLWDLIKDHQARCDYEKIKKLIGDLDGSHPMVPTRTGHAKKYWKSFNMMPKFVNWYWKKAVWTLPCSNFYSADR